MKRYFTKTGIELTVIQGLGLGDGIAIGDLKLLSPKKAKKAKGMTKGEFFKLEKRVDRIETAIALCDPKWDEDVLDNLQAELESIIVRLEASLAS